MAGNFASSVFSSGPKDDYRVADVYSQNGKGVISSYTERSAAPNNAGLAGMFGNMSGGDAFKFAKGTVAYGKGIQAGSGNALDRAIGGLSGLGSSLRGASPSLQNSLMKNISGTQNIYAQIGNTVARLKSGNLPDIRSLTGMINGVAGSNLINISDRNSIAGMTAGLITQATRTGIPKSFSSLTKNLMGDPQLISQVITKAVPSVIRAGDIGTLKEMAEVDPRTIQAAVPDIFGDFSAAYTSPPMCTVNDRIGAFGEIKDTFGTINPDWNQSIREVTTDTGEVIPVKGFDITAMANASPDMRETFRVGALNSSDPDDKLWLVDPNPKTYTEPGITIHEVQTDGMFTKSPDPVREQLKEQFPEVVLAKRAEAETLQASVVSGGVVNNGVPMWMRVSDTSTDDELGLFRTRTVIDRNGDDLTRKTIYTLDLTTNPPRTVKATTTYSK